MSFIVMLIPIMASFDQTPYILNFKISRQEMWLEGENIPAHIKHERIHYRRNERDITAGIHSSAILARFVSVLWRCCATLTGYCMLHVPVQQILIKRTDK